MNRSIDETLGQIYLDSRERLYRLIIESNGVGTKTYANTILQALEKELAQLKKQSNAFIDTRVPNAYRRELDSLYAYFQRNHLRMKNPANFASLHTDAIYEIAREMQYQLDDALITVGRQVKRYVALAQDQALRQAGLRQTATKIASGGTVDDMQAALIKELQESGFMTVQYGSGKNARQVPIDVYANMVARSTTREAGNTARLNQLTANGYDLVTLTEHYPTCAVCAKHQGRVYSISGNDKRFPPLSKAFGAYNNIHPNCRHVAVPFIESLRTPEEMTAALERSNRPWGDTRSAEEVAIYKAQQDKARKTRNTLYQYERYKAALGDDAPKSYVAFNRIKKADGEAWKYLQLDYRRRNHLKEHPELALPNAAAATASNAKFTSYLFAGHHAAGLAKGVAFDSRLGYNIDNWESLKSDILSRCSFYPSTNKGLTAYGTRYEQLMILQGLKDKPANVVVSWLVNGENTHLTSCYIKEVK